MAKKKVAAGPQSEKSPKSKKTSKAAAQPKSALGAANDNALPWNPGRKPEVEADGAAPPQRAAQPATPAGKMRYGVPEIYFKAQELLEQKLGLFQAAAQPKRAGAMAGALGIENICGIGIGYKNPNPRDAGVRAIVVQVRRKARGRKDDPVIDPAFEIPKFIMVDGKQIPVDVEEAPEPASAQLAKPGESIGIANGHVGTFGAVVKVRNDPATKPPLVCILGNAHVLARNKDDSFATDAETGLPIQRNGGDIFKARLIREATGGNANGAALGWLWHYALLSLHNSSGMVGASSPADAAVALTPPLNHANATVRPHDVSDLLEDAGEPEEQMEVFKIGMHGTTFGRISKVNQAFEIAYGRTAISSSGPPFAHFQGGLEIRSLDGGPFSKPGDSGSLIIARQSKKAVALLVGGDGTRTFANPIQAVVTQMNIIKFYNAQNTNT